MAAFTPGDLVIYRVGTGSGSLSSAATAVFLDEYRPDGTFVQSIALPTADNGANQTLTASGTATSEGLLTLSADGHYLMFTGYDAAPGTASIAGTSSSTICRPAPHGRSRRTHTAPFSRRWRRPGRFKVWSWSPYRPERTPPTMTST